MTTTKSLHDAKPRSLANLNQHISTQVDSRWSIVEVPYPDGSRWDLIDSRRPQGDDMLRSVVAFIGTKLRSMSNSEWTDAVIRTILSNTPDELAKEAVKIGTKLLDSAELSATQAITRFTKKATENSYKTAIQWGAEEVIRAEFALELVKEARKEFEAGNWTDLLRWAQNAKRWMSESLMRGPDVGNGVSFYKFADMSEQVEKARQLDSLNGMVGRLLFELEPIHEEINKYNEREA